MTRSPFGHIAGPLAAVVFFGLLILGGVMGCF
jgi:hypothetical protein